MPVRPAALPSRLRFSVIAVGLLLGALATPVPVRAEVALNPDHPQRYTVQPGDTLWGIAGRFLRDPWDWRHVWQENRGEVGGNPNRIYPGEVLELSYAADGSPRVSSARGGGMRTVTLTPRVRVTEIDRAIPTIPINVVAPFLSRPVVTDAKEIDDAPYVVGFPEGHIVAGTGDAFYVRRILASSDDRYEVLRPGQEYRDPRTNEVLGFEASYVAEARLERVGDPAILVVAHSEVEVALGDRVRPTQDSEPIRSFTPVPAPVGLEATIISVLNGVTQIGQYDIVVLDRGSRNGVAVGQVFEVYAGGDLRRDQVRARRSDWNWRNETPLDTTFWYGDWEITGWERDRPDPNDPLPLHREARRKFDRYIAPETRAGIVMVFRVFDRVSFALVMFASQALHVGNAVASPDDG